MGGGQSGLISHGYKAWMRGAARDCDPGGVNCNSQGRQERISRIRNNKTSGCSVAEHNDRYRALNCQNGMILEPLSYVGQNSY